MHCNIQDQLCIDVLIRLHYVYKKIVAALVQSLVLLGNTGKLKKQNYPTVKDLLNNKGDAISRLDMIKTFEVKCNFLDYLTSSTIIKEVMIGSETIQYKSDNIIKMQQIGWWLGLKLSPHFKMSDVEKSLVSN